MGALKVKVAGVWQTIVGPQGAQGPQGPTGPTGPSGTPVGMPMPWLLGETTVPAGFLVAKGQEVSSATYPALAALFGTTFGSASSGNFRMPNLQGRVFMGIDPTGGAATTGVPKHNAVGDTGGVKSVTLTAAESGLRDHSHSTSSDGGHQHNYNVPSDTRSPVGGGSLGVWASLLNGVWATPAGQGAHNHTITASGSYNALSAHANMQPFYAGLWIIRALP